MKKKAIRKLISIVLTGAMILSCTLIFSPLVSASTSSDINSLKNQQAALEKKLAEIEKQIKNNKNNQSTTASQLEDIESQIDNITNQIAVLNDIIKKTDARLAQSKKELGELSNQVDSDYDSLKERIRVNYESGNLSYFSLILESQDMADFLSRKDIVADILDSDKKKLNALQDKLSDVKKLKEQIEQDQSENKAAKAKLDKQTSSLKAAKKSSEALLAKLKKENAAYLAQLSKVDNQIDEINKQIDKLVSDDKYVGGTFLWPLKNYKRISSYYGWRTDPFSGAKKFHQAIDIPAPVGTPLLAINAGTVISVGWDSLGGNYVAVDHGGGITSRFYHCNKIIVKRGQKVKKGQVIAYVGKTGKVTGAHVHFAIYKNGSSVNPLSYYS